MAQFSSGELLETTTQLKLVDLPADALFYLFKFCDLVTLRNLSITCKRFNEIVSEDCVWVKRSNACLITNQLSCEIKRRSYNVLSCKEKCRIGANWKYGRYRERIYSTSSKYMPWTFLESDILWVSRGRTILGVKRLRDGLKMQAPLYSIQPAHSEDISRFIKVENIIFTGGKDKYICAWDTSSNTPVFCQHSNHSHEIQGLDCKRHILVTGSKDNTLKVWQVHATGLHCVRTVHVADRVWSIAIDPSLTSVASGSAGYYGVHPLHIYDLDRGLERSLARSVLHNGAAVFDIQWECPNTLITCGFDSITRLWDLRVGVCVGSWPDPFGAPGYCLATDLRYSVLCGTAHHGRAQLWDKRTFSSVQAYFGSSTASSPVYSVSFDPCQLFLAQDSCVNVLDFMAFSQPGTYRADFSSHFSFKRSKQL